MLSLKIAARFLGKSPLQSLFIVAGIAVGIGVQVFVGSLITSLQASLIEQTIGSSPHLTVLNLDEKKPLKYTGALRAVVKTDPGVSTAVPVRNFASVYRKGTDSAGLLLTGGVLAELDTIYKISKNTVAGRPRLRFNDVMVGVSFAKKFSLKPGDTVVVIQPNGGRSRLKLSGIFDLGSAAANDQVAFVPSSLARTALGMQADEYSSVIVQLREPFKSTATARHWRLRHGVTSVQFKDWQVQNRDLLTALQSQSSSSYMIQGFVLIAIALGITSTLAVSSVQKTRQIGILKAMGLSDGRSGLVFLWAACILGVSGTAAGVAAGLGLIAFFQFLSTRSPQALFPIVPQTGFILLSACIGIAVALLSSIIPIRRTSRIDPIEVIQSG